MMRYFIVKFISIGIMLILFSSSIVSNISQTLPLSKPSEAIYEFEDDRCIILSADNISPDGLTLVIAQSG